jgi:hypothetical protein
MDTFGSSSAAASAAAEAVALLRGDLDDLRARELRLQDAVSERASSEVIALKARIAALEASLGRAAVAAGSSTAGGSGSLAVVAADDISSGSPTVDECSWLEGCVCYPLDGPLVPLRPVDVELLGSQAASGIPVQISALLPNLSSLHYLRLVGCGLADEHASGLGESACGTSVVILLRGLSNFAMTTR